MAQPHPSGGAKAWCIGEGGLLNPYNNGTELVSWPNTVSDEEELRNFKPITTQRWPLSGSSTQPCIMAEIEDLDKDLFDKRGRVEMQLFNAKGKRIGKLNRKRFRWVASGRGEYAAAMAGKAKIRYEHDRGNAGGHIQVACKSFAVSVGVAANTGLGGGPASGNNVYLDGQFADVQVQVTPSIYQNFLTKARWNRVDTYPSGNGRNNPAGKPIRVHNRQSGPGTWQGRIWNIRWAGIQTGTDTRFGEPQFCNRNIDWVIDGTFQVAGINVSAAQPGHLIATVTLGDYINGAAPAPPRAQWQRTDSILSAAR